MIRHKTESNYKTEFVRRAREHGAYARRIEDQFAVGMLDMLVVIPELPVFLIEATVVKASFVEPSPRQGVEIARINALRAKGGGAVAVLLGFGDERYYVAARNTRIPLSSMRDYRYEEFNPVTMLTQFWRDVNGQA
jgi:hypothetical protein